MSILCNILKSLKVITYVSAKAKESSADDTPVPKPQAAAEAPGGAMSKMSDMIKFNPIQDDGDDDDDWGDD